MSHRKHCIMFWNTWYERQRKDVSEAASVTSCGAYIPSLQSKAKISDKHLFQSLLNHCSEKRNSFLTFKVPDSIKNKTAVL